MVKKAASKLTYVYETIKILKKQLPEDKALIGFTGAPWTLATYMIEEKVQRLIIYLKNNVFKSRFLHKILRKLTEVVKLYLEKQILAGADVVQILILGLQLLNQVNMMNFLGNIWWK